MTRGLERGATLAVLLATATLTACHSLSEGARRDFSTDFTCPLERVEVRAREDLHPSDWFKGPARTPPREIAVDPARLKMWQDRENEQRHYADSYHHIFEANGCGHRALYECGHSTRGSSTSWICYSRTDPPVMVTASPQPVPEVLPPATSTEPVRP